MKTLFCLLLLLIFSGVTPLSAARIDFRPATTVEATSLRLSPEVRPGDRHALPGISPASLPSGSKPYSYEYVIREAKAGLAANGKRYSLKERLVLSYLKKQLKKLRLQDGEPIDPRRLKQGRLALILGAGAFVVAFIPILQILSPLMAIAAIVLGIVSLRGNSNLPGILGICFGGAFLLLILLVIAILVLTFSFW